jgi:hypothetical protein
MVEERAAGPCRPPLLTHVCKRGGVRRAPSGFSLVRNGPGACSPARIDRVGPPILIVLDQNRETSVGIANALLEDIIASCPLEWKRGNGGFSSVGE